MYDRNEYAVTCIARDGTKSVWLYEISDSRAGAVREWHVRAWPQDGRHPSAGGEWYDIVLEEQSVDTARVAMANNHLPAKHRGRGLAPALYPLLARRLGRRIVSSRTSVAGTNEYRTNRATAIWEYLAENGEADRIPDSDIYLIDGRPEFVRATTSGPVPVRNTPTNEAEFNALMVELDNQLQAEGAPLSARPLRALGEASKVLAAEFSIEVAAKDYQPSGYEGKDFVTRLSRWFDDRYGSRLLVDFSPGKMAVLLRGDIWLIKFPKLYGRFELVADKGRKKQKDFIGTRPKGVNPRHDVLDSVVGLPDGLRNDLTKEELDYLIFSFVTGISAYDAIYRIKKERFVREARADHEAAVVHLSETGPHHYGLSRWGSLQAAEKMYKAYIATCTPDVPFGHDLSALARTSEAFGLEPADPHFIALVQCPASVRYGEGDSTRNDAIESHHAALELTWYIAEAIEARLQPGAN